MTLETSVHRNILLHILKDIFSNTKLGQLLGFKGGTAAYLFYDLPRFSVDLDFDLLDLKEESYVFENIQTILEGYGSVKDARKKRYSIFFLLSYPDKIQNAYNIKVEINLRNFGSRYEVKSYLGIPMNIMIQEDVCAHKLVAMLERIGQTNRDIFDVWFFLSKNWPTNELIIYQRTNLSMKDFLQKCIDELESINDRGILSGLGELLSETQKKWVKEKLRTETIFLLKVRLSSLK